MNVRRNHKIRFTLELAHYMRENIRRTEIYAKVYLCTLVVAYALVAKGPPKFVVGAVAGMWILDLGTLWKAIQEVRRRERDNRLDSDSQEDLERYR